MASSTCWRCLARPSADQLSSILSRTHLPSNPGAIAAFSTSSAQAMPMPMKKKNTNHKDMGGPKKGKSQFTLKKKKKKVEAKSRAELPRVGERKATRRRIVLSNTSALEVPLDEVNAQNIADPGHVGSVLAMPDEMIDRLRASNAFRKTQGWQYFRRPAMLIREETVRLAQEMKEIENRQIGRVLTGERGSGKSLLLLQAQAIAFQQGWTVINLGEAQYIVDGSKDYRPVPQVRPMVYDQRGYLVEIMRRASFANPTLRDLPLSMKHELPTPVKSDASIHDLAYLGGRDNENAPLIFEALWKELTAPGRPPILITLDGIAHIMKETTYKSPQFDIVHAHDLTIVRWFMSRLSGQTSLPNGGMVMAATSASNEPKIPALQFRLHQLEVKQALEQGLPNPRADAELPDAMLPFLLATGQQPNPVPQPDAHTRYDMKVFDVLGSPYNVVAGNNTADPKEVQVQKVKGVTKEDARAMMEYWARSGVMRQTIDERIVGEKWSLSGGGIPGELERACIKFRI